MTGTQLFRNFNIASDDAYTYWNTDSVRSSYILNIGQRNAVKKLLDKGSVSTEVHELLKPFYIINEVLVPTTNGSIVLYSALAEDLERIEMLQCKYTVNGVVKYFEADMYMTERGSASQAATERYPKYSLYGVGNTSAIRLYPSGCLQVTISYYMTPADISSTGSTDLGYRDTFYDMIVKEMILEASNPMRDYNFQQTTKNLLTANSTT